MLDLNTITNNNSSNEQYALPDELLPSRKLPKSKKKCRKQLKKMQRKTTSLLIEYGQVLRENELLRDIIKMSSAAADNHLDARAAKNGLTLSKRTSNHQRKKGGRS